MKRGTPLQRKTPLRAQVGMSRKPVQSWTDANKSHTKASLPSRRRDTEPSRKVRQVVLERDGYACVACGKPIGQAAWWSMQHRVARGQGGRNEPFNLIVLCGSATSAGCHRRAEDRDREFNARGYWLHSWEDPAATPLMVFSPGGSGVMAWPTADGRYVFEAPAGAA